MREIKFRYKRIVSGTAKSFDKNRMLKGKSFYEKRWFYHTIGGEEMPHDVITKTIGQYIGLKDKNSKEIYEGDIVKVRKTENKTLKIIMTVDWSEESCRFVLQGIKDNKGWYSLIYKSTHEYEVIGNIHDNPELLKEEK